VAQNPKKGGRYNPRKNEKEQSSRTYASIGRSPGKKGGADQSSLSRPIIKKKTLRNYGFDEKRKQVEHLTKKEKNAKVNPFYHG